MIDSTMLLLELYGEEGGWPRLELLLLSSVAVLVASSMLTSVCVLLAFFLLASVITSSLGVL